MNFNPFGKRDRDSLGFGDAVDLDSLAEALRKAPPLERPAHEFAPRQKPVERVETFLALPLQEVDAVMASLKSRYEEVVTKGQELRDLMMAARREHMEHIERERAFAEFTKETFDVLAEKYLGLGKTAPAALPAPSTHAEAPQTATEREETEAA